MSEKLIAVSSIPNKTVFDIVTLPYRFDWRKHVEGDPARTISEERFVEEMLQHLSTTEFLQLVSYAIEQRLETLKGNTP